MKARSYILFSLLIALTACSEYENRLRNAENPELVLYFVAAFIWIAKLSMDYSALNRFVEE